MRVAAPCRLALWTVACLAAAGCNRPLNVERTLVVEPGLMRAVEVDAPVADQQVVVTVSSPGAPVDVWLVLDEEYTKMRKTEDWTMPEKFVANQKKVEQGSVEGKVPGKTKFAVVLHNPNSKTANAKVTVKSK